MRDIKFRAWDKKRKLYEYDVQDADLSEAEHSMERFGDYFPSEFDGKLYDYFDIEQYTGLKDKTAKKFTKATLLKFILITFFMEQMLMIGTMNMP